MSACTNKYGEPKRKFARAYRAKAEALIMSDKKQMKMVAYHCWKCKHWHVGTYMKLDNRDYIAHFADMIAGAMRGHIVPGWRTPETLLNDNAPKLAGDNDVKPQI